MARAWHPSGLSHYLRPGLYDIDVEALRKEHLRPYLEHRLYQVESCLEYLSQRYRQRPLQAADRAHLLKDLDAATALVSDMLDIVYLQSMRKVIAETLETV